MIDSASRIETLRPNDGDEAIQPEKERTSSPMNWWERYSEALQALPLTTRDAVAADAAYIAERAVPGTLTSIDEKAFGQNRVRTGIVVGSVQSGKTASMLAVAALLLDRQVDILIILAGTRVALWLQTYERLLEQLDGSSLFTAWERNANRTLVPQPEDILGSTERVDPARYLRGARNKVKSALANRRPIIFVVPKEDDHLLALGRFLEEHTSAASITTASPATTVVVLDDEADDASVLDASDSGKITPKFIQQLWASSKTSPSTRHGRLFATYIAYTATPQANYLQQTHNPLAPRDFHAALRVPSDHGLLSPRSTTYTEPVGLKAYYTGGDFYYERFRDLPADPCIAYPFPISSEIADAEITQPLARYESVRWQMIGDALRSYFVSGAIRLYLSARKIPDFDAPAMPKEALNHLLPPPHSMLYHPSALKDDQFAGAADIVRWSKSGEVDQVVSTPDDGLERSFELDARGLTRRLHKEESLWANWLEKFKYSANALSTIPGLAQSALQSITWDQIKETLIHSIFSGVKIRVLNSDPRAGDRPEFSPQRIDKDLWRPPRDLFTIFVAGNVLSRGLTVEGLCTSLFLRSAREPAADTQMQMQRWFGYRGVHFAFCRVFAFSDQLNLFRQYHNNDQAMKTEIIAHMDHADAPFGNGVLVLQGQAFKATSKVESRRVPLHPGPTPSIRLIEPSNSPYYASNIDVLQALLQKGGWQPLEYPHGSHRGLIKAEPVSLLEAACILESLRYSSHDPDPSLDLSNRWESLQMQLGLSEPLFRPPGVQCLPMATDPSGCPYSIAAYLRLWDAALTRPNAPGLMPTDNPSMPWNLLNIASYRRTAPRFYIGVRFGSEEQTKQLTYEGKPFPMMRRGYSESRDDTLATLWGSRNPTERWFGDQVFDYHYHNASGAPRLLDEGSWRPRGHPGLLLFHPIIEPSSKHEVLAIGLAIPRGGPDHVAALRGHSDD